MIKEIKEKVLKRLNEMDVDNMSVDELKEYVKVFGHLTSISEKSSTEYLDEIMNKMSEQRETVCRCACVSDSESEVEA